MTGEDFNDPTRAGSPLVGKHYQPSPTVAIVILVLFVASLVGVFHYVSPLSVAGTSTVAGSSTTTTSHTPSTTIAPGLVKVQVANGTSTPHLAGSYTQTLITSNWDALPAINSPSMVSSTIVGYRVGFRWAAVRIAALIKAPASSVAPFAGVAAQIAHGTSDDVVVVLGVNAVG